MLLLYSWMGPFYEGEWQANSIEAIVQPDGAGNNVRRESVAFICVHRPILAISAR
jgi:hypothetical protein